MMGHETGQVTAPPMVRPKGDKGEPTTWAHGGQW